MKLFVIKCWVSRKQKLWLFFKRITVWYYHNSDKTCFHFSFSHSLEPCSESTLNSLHFCWFLLKVCVPPNHLNTPIPASPSLLVEYDSISSQLSSEIQRYGLFCCQTLDYSQYSPDKVLWDLLACYRNSCAYCTSPWPKWSSSNSTSSSSSAPSFQHVVGRTAELAKPQSSVF